MALTKIIASMVSFVQAGVGAVVRTVQDKLRDTTSAFDFLTTAQIADVVSNTGAVDVAPALQAAIDAVSGKLRLPVGTYRLGSQLIVRGNCTGLEGHGEYTTTLSKQFNGEAVSALTNGSVYRGFGISGNGATRSGGGILPEGYNILITKVRITDTADAPIIVKAAVGSNANAATYLTVYDCFLLPTNLATTFAVRSIGTDDAGRPTCRTFSKLSGGGPLVDFGGMNYPTLTMSLGTNVKFNGSCGKVHMSGVRITSQTNITIYGVDHIITDNSWGFGSGAKLTIDGTSSNVTFDSSNAISYDGSYGSSPVIGHALGGGVPSFLHTGIVAFPVQWYGTVTNPTLGNASKYAYYKLSGGMCWMTLSITTGSTTDVGSGVYTFQLPFKALVGSIGSALIRSSSGAEYPCVFVVQGSGTVGLMYLVAGATAPFGSTSLAFGAGAGLDITVNYPLALS